MASEPAPAVAQAVALFRRRNLCRNPLKWRMAGGPRRRQ
jgi:hypothetical protein